MVYLDTIRRSVILRKRQLEKRAPQLSGISGRFGALFAFLGSPERENRAS